MYNKYGWSWNNANKYLTLNLHSIYKLIKIEISSTLSVRGKEIMWIRLSWCSSTSRYQLRKIQSFARGQSKKSDVKGVKEVEFDEEAIGMKLALVVP
jgi:hypothetical protein